MNSRGQGVSCPPDLYPLASFLARRFACTHVVGVGCGAGEELARLRPEFEIVWVDWDLERRGRSAVPDAVLEHSVLVCEAVGERPDGLLDALRSWLELAPVCLLAAPGRDPVGRHDDSALVGAWTPAELEERLRAAGLNVAFVGLTTTDDRGGDRNTVLAVLERTGQHSDQENGSARRDAARPLRATAIVPAYNEQDVIAPSMSRLIEQGLDVYVIDNWSTDATYEVAAQFAGRGLAGIERFPAAGPVDYYDWKSILRRVEDLSLELESDWFLFQSVDEVRRSPWPGVRLLDAFRRVEAAGFNAVDFTVVEFHPVDNAYPPGSDFEAYFRHFDFGKHPGHLCEINAWKNLGRRPAIAASGGHEAAFEGRRVYPFKFLLKHYPVRSQEHGERKVLRERQERWSPEERAAGWHSHYDHVTAGHTFLRDPHAFWAYDEHFERRFLAERLSGVGVHRAATPCPDAAEADSALREALAEREREARALTEQLRFGQQHVANLEAELAVLRSEIERIRRAPGWRLLNRYGKLKYRYLLPLYRALGLGPDS